MTTPSVDLAGWKRLLSLENTAGRERFEEDRARLDPSGRIEAGLAVGGLVVVDTTGGPLGRASWLLETKNGDELGPQPSSGDPVLVYRKRFPEEAIKGLVSRRTRRSLTVVFEEPPAEVLESSELVVEREWDVHSHERLTKGLQIVESARGRDAFWKKLIIGEASAGQVEPVAIRDPSLNEQQNIALSKAMGAPDVFLVHGPPGTGKTQTLAAIAAAEVEAGGTVLACAASNAAVDNLVVRLGARGLAPMRLGHPARVLPQVVESTLEARAAQHPNTKVAEELVREARELLRRADRATKQGRSADRYAEARECRYAAKRLFAEARALSRGAQDEVLQKADVVCATLTGLGQRMRGRRFTLLIVDEATQATVPATLLGLLKADRVVLAGDQNQLPPTVLSQDASRQGLARTLYERLVEKQPDTIATMLEEQYRMHSDIMTFSSEQLYDGLLTAHQSVASHTLNDLPPVLFVDTAGKGWDEERPEETESIRNPLEAARVALEVQSLREMGVEAGDIAVIAPYAAQVQLLRTLLPEDALEVDTVDAFQGREKEAVVVSLTRSNEYGELGFVADVRRMNVALTRARKRLVVIGDSATMGGHPFYAAFVQYVQDRGYYRSAWEEPE